MLSAEHDPGPTLPPGLTDYASTPRAAAATRRTQREAENADH
jgi:hypothetical protein